MKHLSSQQQQESTALQCYCNNKKERKHSSEFRCRCCVILFSHNRKLAQPSQILGLIAEYSKAAVLEESVNSLLYNLSL